VGFLHGFGGGFSGSQFLGTRASSSWTDRIAFFVASSDEGIFWKNSLVRFAHGLTFVLHPFWGFCDKRLMDKWLSVFTLVLISLDPLGIQERSCSWPEGLQTAKRLNLTKSAVLPDWFGRLWARTPAASSAWIRHLLRHPRFRALRNQHQGLRITNN